MARIAVVGAGAIGCTVAAWLVHAGGHEVQLCVRSPVDDLLIETPSGPVRAAPIVRTDPEQVQAADWVFVATKAYDAGSVQPWLAPLLTPSNHVAILQNGVEHRDRFAGLAAPERLVPVIVDVPAERTGPGRVHQRRMGSMVVPADDAGRAFVELMANTPIEAAVDADFLTASWRKLAINCAGAVTALALRPAGIARMDAVASVMRELVAECVAVGRAEGAKLGASLCEDVVASYRRAPADSINSLHADRLAGRPTEWDARNGVIVRLGARHGIPTPLNHMAAALLAAAES